MNDVFFIVQTKILLLFVASFFILTIFLIDKGIELGMEIPTIESRASNIPIDKGNYIWD